MIGKYFRRIGGLILAALMLPGIVLVAGASVEAQSRRQVIIVRRPYRPFWGWRYRDPFWRTEQMRYSRYVFSNSEKAFDRGYKDGLKVGRGDIKNARSYDPQRSHYFQEAGFGNFGEVYRSGFNRGYADGFRT
jgi:hypothetical protein